MQTLDPVASIARILRPNGDTAGAGFLCGADGLIATCTHVIEDARGEGKGSIRVQIHSRGGPALEAGVVCSTPSHKDDVAVLRLQTPPADLPRSLPLSHVYRKGRQYSTFGYPSVKSKEGLPARLLITGETEEDGLPALAVESDAVSLGFSGGPVWDDDTGVVVGMVVSTLPAGADPAGKQNLVSFLRPVSVIRRACRRLGLTPGCPYRGLESFGEDDADLYFGRDQAIRAVVGALAGSDVVAVVGVSGSGKSSLLGAGLKHGLDRFPDPGLVGRPRLLLTAGASPLRNLAVSLSDRFGRNLEEVAAALGLPRNDEAGASHLDPAELVQAITDISGQPRPILLLDQAERLFTECLDRRVRSQFVQMLREAGRWDVRTLLALRADFYGEALRDESDFGRMVSEGQVTLYQMTEEELHEAIERPAVLFNRGFESGLVDRIARDVLGRAGDLPLLEFALTELWARDAESGVLTNAGYEALGFEAADGTRYTGAQGAIAKRAEYVWRSLSPTIQDGVQRLFLRILTPGSQEGLRIGVADTIRRVWRTELDPATQEAADVLTEARLMTTGTDPSSGERTVEIAHEALTRAWPRLRKFAADYGAFMRWYEQLQPMLRSWLTHGEPLLADAMLSEALEWRARYPTFVEGKVAEYMTQSQLALEERFARATSQHQRDLATARQLSTESLAVEDGQLRLLLAAEGLRRSWCSEADRAMRDALANERWSMPMVRAGGAVQSVAFGPEGELVAVGSADGTARVVDRETGTEVARVQHVDRVEKVVFSPMGRYLATASIDGTARLVIAETGEEVFRIEHRGKVRAVAFSPDGRYLATASDDGTARVVDFAAQAEVATVRHRRPVWAVAFGPDGVLVATASLDATARLTDLGSGDEVIRVHHRGPVRAVAFSPDARCLATGSDDDSAWVVDCHSGDRLFQVKHDEWVWAVAFSPDSRCLATGSDDGTARVVHVVDGAEITTVKHNGAVRAVAFSPDSQHVATASGDHQARVVELHTGVELLVVQHAAAVRAVAFTQDGRGFATGSVDKTARLMPWRREDLLAQARLRATRNLTPVEWSRYVGSGPFRKTFSDLP